MRTEIINIVNKVFSLGIIGLQISIVAVFFYLAFLKKKYKLVFDFLNKNSLRLAFLISLIATCGSLFYSLYAKFVPCELCWYQRIFMYSLAVIFGLALIKKDNKIIDYALVLSSIGAIISLYHNYIYFKATTSTFCVLGKSCIEKYVSEFGYITIPIMSLTAFLSIIILMLVKKYSKSNN